MEVVPRSGSLISRKSFGDSKIHLEFRNVGGPTNSGVYIQDRYEVNINEVYGRIDGNPCAGFDNCTPADAKPGIRCSRPPLEWQTLDIDFHAPRFDASGTKIANARATVLFNGTLVYNNRELGPVTLNAARLGEAPTGPIQLQEHGMPVQFRNIWVIASTIAAPVPAARARKLQMTRAIQPIALTPVVTTADTSGKPAKQAGFVHPGVLLNRAQLEEIRKRVANGTEPQKSAFEKLKTSPLGALDYTPHPRETVECGPRSNPDLGCKAEQADSEAAYAQALLWYISGNEAYAKNAIRIMNSWSSTLTGGHTNANGPVQASWTGDVWPRAAEIMRYLYKGWPDAEIARFQNMLTTQYLPSLIHGTCENGNKELTMSEALINIGVFNDNRAAFEHGIKMWRGRAPAYIYLKSDGPSRSSLRAVAPRFGATKASLLNWWRDSCRKPRAIPAMPTSRSPPWWTPPKRHVSRASICMPSRANASWLRWNTRRSPCRRTARSLRKISSSMSIPPGKSPTITSTTASE